MSVKQFGQFSLEKIVFILLVIILAIRIAFTIGLITSAVDDIIGVEPNVIFTIQQAMVGQPLYPDPELPPFPVTQYTPLYYLVTAGTANLLGIVPGDQVVAIYILGRTLSFAASIILAALVFYICRQYGANRTISFGTAVLSLLLPMPWYSLARPDAFAALFGLSSVILFSKHLLNEQSSSSRWLLIICGVLGFLAPLSKQSGAMFLISIGLFCLIRFKFKDLAYVVLGSLIAFIVTSLIFVHYYNVIPGSQNYFYAHTIGTLNHGIYWQEAYRQVYAPYLSWYFAFAALPITVIIFMFYEATQQGITKLDKITVFWALTFVIIAGSNLALSLRLGSAIHYMNEAMIIAVLMLIYISRQSYMAMLNTNLLFRIGLSVYIILSLSILSFDHIFHFKNRFSIQFQDQYDVEAINYLNAEIAKDSDLLIYSEPRTITNVLFKNSVFPQTELSILGYSRSLLRYDNVEPLIQTGRLRYIVLSRNTSPSSDIFGHPVHLQLIKQTSSLDIYLISAN